MTVLGRCPDAAEMRWRLALWAARARLEHAQWLFWARALAAGARPCGWRLTPSECIVRAGHARRRLARIKAALGGGGDG